MNMTVVTVPKKEYEDLRQKASLYEVLLRSAPDKVFGIEMYSKARLREFLKEDRVDRKTREKIMQRLSQ